MRRAWLYLFALLALVLGVAAGCGGGDEEGGGEVTPGKTITVLSLWGGSEKEAFQKVLDGFTKKTGVKTKYETARDFLPVLRPRIAAGNPPNVAIIPRPGILADFAREGSIKSLEELGVDADVVNENYSQAWIDLTTVDGTQYGVVAKANSKSTIWYKPDSFKQQGFQIPKAWDELLDITDKYRAAGKKPWAIGAQGTTNSWTLTDWFENIYVRQAGPDAYAELFSGGRPFTDVTVTQALQEMIKIINNENVPGGIEGVLGTDFVSSIGQVFGTNPKAEMHGQGGFVGGIAIGQVNPKLKAGTDINFFPFPEIAPEHGSPLVGGGDITAAFADTPEVRALVEYLASPEAGEIWVSTGAIVSPNKGVPDSAYPNELVKAEAEQVKNAEVFRFDGSDLLPGALGQEWGTTLQAIVQNPDKMRDELQGFQSQAETEFAA